jgi:hypothetical protein
MAFIWLVGLAFVAMAGIFGYRSSTIDHANPVPEADNSLK